MLVSVIRMREGPFKTPWLDIYSAGYHVGFPLGFKEIPVQILFSSLHFHAFSIYTFSGILTFPFGFWHLSLWS